MGNQNVWYQYFFNYSSFFLCSEALKSFVNKQLNLTHILLVYCPVYFEFIINEIFAFIIFSNYCCLHLEKLLIPLYINLILSYFSKFSYYLLYFFIWFSMISIRYTIILSVMSDLFTSFLFLYFISFSCLTASLL